MELIDKDALVAEIERLISNGRVKLQESQENNDYESNIVWSEHIATCRKILNIINTLEIKEVNLNEYYHKFLEKEWFGNSHVRTVSEMMAFTAKHFFELGLKVQTKWQKERFWKPADGDDLPEIDREVIALLDNGKVVFAHRPQEYWDGKDIDTDKVTRHYPKTYDKGGWNIPNVKYWLDCLMPKEIEL